MESRYILLILTCLASAYAFTYCNPILDVCTAAGIRCPDKPNSCTVPGSSYTIDFNRFDVVCMGHLYLPDGFIKGRVAMGHDFNVEGNRVKKNVTIGQGLTSSDGIQRYSFVSASDVSWPYGHMFPADSRALIHGHQYGIPNSVKGRIDVCHVDNCLTPCFANTKSYYKAVSSLFASQSSTATSSVSSSGILSITCSSSSRAIYFLSISGSTFSKVKSYDIKTSCNTQAIFVFNIQAESSSILFDGTPISASGVVYNIIGSSPNVNLKSSVRGTILNLNGEMNQNAGTLFGWLISSECVSMRQVERPICSGTRAPSSTTTTASATATTTASATATTTASATATTTTSSRATTGRVSAQTSTSTSSSTSSSSSCTDGNMRCVSSETYQACAHGSWGATQSCNTGLTCHPSGNNIYCY